ncbi:TPA: hypothetical protein EYH33_01215 [Candidatus Bipolaricaulota bacterium]|nr:hypothetical protein [Candidatus Bipolaricaulota bacterium]
MKRMILIAAALLIGLSASLLGAQATAVVRVSWTVLPFAIISLEGSGEYGDSVVVVTEIPEPTAFDLARGYIELPGAVTLRVMSNTHWTVLVQALSPTLGTSYDGTFTWPVEHLAVGVGGDYVPVSLSPQPIAAGKNGQYLLAVDYRVNVPATGVPAGDYRAVLLYTVTTD